MALYQCPKCKVAAEIKGKEKKVSFNLRPGVVNVTFPTHHDCELAKAIKDMDISKLTKVKGEEY